MLDNLLHNVPQKVSLVIAVVAMMGLWLWALGKVPIPGEYGFVYQAEISKRIKLEVGQDIDQLKKQSAETSTKVDNIKVALDQILADYYSKRIKDGVRQRCKLPVTAVEDRDRLWDQITKDVNLYRMYSGDLHYERPSCSDV